MTTDEGRRAKGEGRKLGGGVLAHQRATYAYVGALVDELARAGVHQVCICPGSRSTPLAYALAAHPTLKAWVHVDERSAAFFALGLATSSRQPVALVCTSGTAAANFLPAVVEARYGRVPLIVLTADRPPELRDNGAPQAIDQLNLYGRNAKWFVEMALPEDGEDALRYARVTAARAVATALEGPAGPVHLNLPFREPLTPPDGQLPMGFPGRVEDGRASVVVPVGPRVAAPEVVAALAAELRAHKRGLIVCGPRADPALATAIPALAESLDYPVLADPLSGLRCGPHATGLVLDAYDAFLRDERAARLTPDLVLRVGAIPTSKALQSFMARASRQILVDGDGGWNDPSARVDTVIHADATLLCAALAKAIAEREDDAGIWAEEWRAANRRARGTMDSYLSSLGEPFEGKVFAELAELLPTGARLYVGNSMPVRDLETFYPKNERAVRFLCNRGANGIDGVVSSALGAAADPTDGGPLVLVIGDLSFYHDLNGLLAARRHGLDATIVLLNNDGGGIFSFLPQASIPEHYEELFGTPLGLDFRPIVEAYGCGFAPAASWPEFRAAVGASIGAPGVQVVELRTERARNVALHREVWARVAEAVWRA